MDNENKRVNIEIMALPDLTTGEGAALLSEPSALIIASTSYLNRYSEYASDRFLLLNYDDITNPKRLYSFKPGHAREIQRFVKNALGDNPGTEHIIVACDGGVSRSAALAAALMLWLGQDDETAVWANPDYMPNQLVFGVLCEGLGIKMPEGAIEERVKRNERAMREKIGLR